MQICFRRAAISYFIRAAAYSPSNLRNLRGRLCVFFIRQTPRRRVCKIFPIRSSFPRCPSPYDDPVPAGYARLLSPLAFTGSAFAKPRRLPLPAHLFRVCRRGYRYARSTARHGTGDMEVAALPSVCTRRPRSGAAQATPGATPNHFPPRTVTIGDGTLSRVPFRNLTGSILCPKFAIQIFKRQERVAAAEAICAPPWRLPR